MHSDQMSICSFCLLINFVMVIFLRGCNFLGPLDCIDSKSPSGYETMSEISHTNPRYTCTRHRDNDWFLDIALPLALFKDIQHRYDMGIYMYIWQLTCLKCKSTRLPTQDLASLRSYPLEHPSSDNCGQTLLSSTTSFLVKFCKCWRMVCTHEQDQWR